MGVRTERIWSRLGETRIAGQVGGAALLVSYPLLFLTALRPSVPLFVAVIVVSYLAEAVVFRLGPELTATLSQIHIGVTLRFGLRELALLLLLVRLGEGTTLWFALFTVAVVSLHAARAVQSGLALYVVRRRRLPVFTRRLDLSALRIPDGPPRLLAQGHVRTMLHLDVLAVAGALAAVATGRDWAALAGAGIALGLGVAAAAAMLPHALRARPLADTTRVMAVVNEQIRRHRPEVAIYFSGSLDSAYQINMWLSTLDRLDRPTLVILRERGMVPLLARTSSPVVCVQAARDLPLLDLSTVRVTLFAANVGKNLHMLRIPGIKSVFVNHGDSDKPASFNPYAKAYDEVWVAGPAGRARYLDMRTGVRDDEIVEIGRPQLAPIHVGRETPDPMPTVLYAPTWEGWSDDLHHTSVSTMGPAIVKALLERVPHVRVLYKPHPLIGTRDPAAVRAHEEIVAMIRSANAAREAGGAAAQGPGAESAEAVRARTAAAGRLDELGRRLATFTGAGTGDATADEAQLSRDSSDPGPDDAAWQEILDAWNETFWAAQEPWRHRVITGQHPHLYECFNRCDLLITDISSVANDFIASGKPYAVTNVAGVDAAEFRALYPTAAAGAYLLGPGCGELPDILTEVEKDGPDRMTRERQELKTHLLGPDEPDAMTRFAAAVTALAEKAERTAALVAEAAPGPGPTGVPDPVRVAAATPDATPHDDTEDADWGDEFDADYDSAHDIDDGEADGTVGPAARRGASKSPVN